jgi:hypothetical protein
MTASGQTRPFGDVCSMSALPPKAAVDRTSVDVSNVPCVDGSELARLFFTFAGWSVQPCVRPVSAAHKAAGHNALRGSGPGQKPAFDNAVAHVGCPDRRIDRLCITCCPPSQPSHHAECRRDLGHAASMAYFVGLDVSVKETSVCIVDDAGKIVREARVASDIASSELGWKPDRCRSWLYSVLAEAGLPVICVETRHIRSA